MKAFYTYGILALLILFLAGCEKNGPVELTEDGGSRSTDLNVENAAIVKEPIDPYAQDSTGFFITAASGFDGRLTIAGIVYDGPESHREASLARAILVDKSSPITINNNSDTLGYRTFDLGAVTIDDIPLQSYAERLIDPRISIDTIGFRYVLMNRDGVGGRGFQYSGNHAYQWSISGSPSIPSFAATITSPSAIHVTTPTTHDVLSPGRSLIVRWIGGGQKVSIIISSADASQRPLLQLEVKHNNGGVVIPKRILQLLPTAQSRFLFTFTSESRQTLLIDGYNGTICTRAITSHTLLLNVRR
ncbi:MAG: hypothetical protein HY033_04895 [Ignavibacteriae bacterium]|nr:hypothetical protein [Ignavibacteria bacterium]MBI3364227.1 hypothetical protein [Ignavibacteriota bacterium]